MAVAKIIAGQQEHLELGYIDSKRDWGHAKDYVEVIIPFVVNKNGTLQTAKLYDCVLQLA